MVRNAEIHCSVIRNSKLGNFILYTIHIVCYIKKNKSKTKAKQKQNKSKTKAKPSTQFYVNDDARFIRHIIHIFRIYGRYSKTG